MINEAKKKIQMKKDRLFKILLLLLFSISTTPTVAKYSITKASSYHICTNSYPTSYSIINFALNETPGNQAHGFSPGQTNVDLVIGFSSSAFEFKPSTGTITATGTEIFINSFTITATSITVNITTLSSNNELNSLQFNNIEIRAIATGSGIIRRTNQNFGFKLDNNTRKPTANQSIGDLFAGTPFFLSSATATQNEITDVYAGTTENEIIGIQLNISGNCGSITVNALTFNTFGSTNPGNDISGAAIYYSGTTNLFTTNNLFGSVSNPNGTFTITGNQPLILGAGTYYFWLTYDIQPYGTAYPGSLTDAGLESITINNTTHLTAANPTGARTINDNVFYSINAGNWNEIENWSRFFQGTECNCAPTDGSGYVFIHHNIVLNETYTVDFIIIGNGGIISNLTEKALTVKQMLGTANDGSFNISSPWEIKNVRTSGSGISRASSELTFTGNLNIGSGTTFQTTSGASLTINGNLSIDGTLSLETSNLINSHSSGSTVQGLGAITGTGTITFGVSKTAPLGTNLTISPSVIISGNSTVFTNRGRIIANGNITGSHTGSTWLNEANSILEMGGTTAGIMETGILNASAPGNTVIYSSTGPQIIKNPVSSVYHNVRFTSSGQATKILSSAITVNGILEISGQAQLGVSTSNFNIAANGNWINNSSHSAPFNAGTSTVSFSGNTLISGFGTTTFRNIHITEFGELTGNNAEDKVLVSGNWLNEGDFNHNFSNINFSGTSTISGAAFTVFYSVVVGSSATLTLHAQETYIEGNLTSNGILNHNSALVVFMGEGNSQFIQGINSSLTFHNLAINKQSAGSLIMQLPVIVNNQLSLIKGTITTSVVNLLSLGATAISNEGNSLSFVNGPMAKTGTSAFVFPIGKNGKWARLRIGTSVTSTSFRAEYFDSSFSNITSMANSPSPVLNNVSRLEHWMLDRLSGTGNVSVTLYWENAVWSGIDNCSTGDLRVARFNGTAWENAGNVTTTGSCSGATAGTIATVNVINNFSPFTFSSLSASENFLPVKLVSFEASPVNNERVIVQWTTASEASCDFFTVEKTIDGHNFKEVAITMGAGNSITENHYSIYDHSPFSGVSYYRLKQTDFDGQYIYSVLKAVKINERERYFSVFPNPGKSNSPVSLKSSLGLKGNIECKISDASGRVVFQETIIFDSGDIIKPLHINLNPGLFFLQATDGANHFKEKIIIQ
jgi:hypothetical protein